MSTFIIGSGFRRPAAEPEPEPASFFALLAWDEQDLGAVPFRVHWARERGPLAELARSRGWKFFDIVETSAQPVAAAPPRASRELCITTITDLSVRGRRGLRGGIDGRPYRAELVRRYETLGELSDAGEDGLLRLGFPAEVVLRVEEWLEQFGLEFAPGQAEAEAEAA